MTAKRRIIIAFHLRVKTDFIFSTSRRLKKQTNMRLTKTEIHEVLIYNAGKTSIRSKKVVKAKFIIKDNDFPFFLGK